MELVQFRLLPDHDLLIGHGYMYQQEGMLDIYTLASYIHMYHVRERSSQEQYTHIHTIVVTVVDMLCKHLCNTCTPGIVGNLHVRD